LGILRCDQIAGARVSSGRTSLTQNQCGFFGTPRGLGLATAGAPSPRARGDTTAPHGPLQRLLGDAGLNSELKAISVGVENDALIVTVTGPTRSVLHSNPVRP
jgi:hypothetical protein